MESQSWSYRAACSAVRQGGLEGLERLTDTLAELSDEDLVGAAVDVVEAVLDQAATVVVLPPRGLDERVEAAMAVASAVRAGDGRGIVAVAERLVR